MSFLIRVNLFQEELSQGRRVELQLFEFKFYGFAFEALGFGPADVVEERMVQRVLQAQPDPLEEQPELLPPAVLQVPLLLQLPVQVPHAQRRVGVQQAR